MAQTRPLSPSPSISSTSSSSSSSRNLFVFEAGPRPACVFSFQTPTAPSGDTAACNRPKRRRPLADVDGEWSSRARKKTRLRRFLITSRLSQPFSAPPTHIVDRGSSKIAIWAKQRTLGRCLLRKAAIMNHVRRRALEASQAKRRQMELVRREPVTQSCEPPSVSKCHDTSSPPPTPLPIPSPSPLGLSNYDALDEEDELEHHPSDLSDPGCSLYSDFSVLESTESPEAEEYDVVDMARPSPPKYRPPSPPPDEPALEVLHERMRQKEVSFISFGDV